jgi:hypothetical protein
VRIDLRLGLADKKTHQAFEGIGNGIVTHRLGLGVTPGLVVIEHLAITSILIFLVPVLGVTDLTAKIQAFRRLAVELKGF